MKIIWILEYLPTPEASSISNGKQSPVKWLMWRLKCSWQQYFSLHSSQVISALLLHKMHVVILQFIYCWLSYIDQNVEFVIKRIYCPILSICIRITDKTFYYQCCQLFKCCVSIVLKLGKMPNIYLINTCRYNYVSIVVSILYTQNACLQLFIKHYLLKKI